VSARPAVVKVLERTAGLKGRARDVLLAIALFADSDGTGAWPTQEAIAQFAQMSRRNAQRGIIDLIGAGELAVDYKAGPGGANLYRVLCCAAHVDKAVSTSQRPTRGQAGPCTWTKLCHHHLDKAVSSPPGQSCVTQPSKTNHDHPPGGAGGEEKHPGNKHPHPPVSVSGGRQGETVQNGGQQGRRASLRRFGWVES